MTNTNTENTSTGSEARFPFVTVGLAGGVLFAFLFLMWFVTTMPKVPDDAKSDVKSEPKPNAAAKLEEVHGRNESALNGVGTNPVGTGRAGMSRDKARGELLG